MIQARGRPSSAASTPAAPASNGSPTRPGYRPGRAIRPPVLATGMLFPGPTTGQTRRSNVAHDCSRFRPRRAGARAGLDGSDRGAVRRLIWDDLGTDAIDHAVVEQVVERLRTERRCPRSAGPVVAEGRVRARRALRSPRPRIRDPISPTMAMPSLSGRLYSLAWPAFAENILQTTLQIVSLALVGRLGASTIAAVGLANQIYFVAITVLMGWAVGTTALIARQTGAGQSAQAGAIARQSILLAGVGGLLLGLLGLAARPPGAGRAPAQTPRSPRPASRSCACSTSRPPAPG